MNIIDRLNCRLQMFFEDDFNMALFESIDDVKKQLMPMVEGEYQEFLRNKQSHPFSQVPSSSPEGPAIADVVNFIVDNDFLLRKRGVGDFTPIIYNWWINGKIRLPEDASKIFDMIISYIKYRDRFPELRNININNIEPGELLNALAVVRRGKGKKKSEVESESLKARLKNFRMLDSIGGYNLYLFESHDQCQFFPQNQSDPDYAGWCVVNPGTYDQYASEGPIYFITKGYVKYYAMYDKNPGSYQFKDRYDSPFTDVEKVKPIVPLVVGDGSKPWHITINDFKKAFSVESDE